MTVKYTQTLGVRFSDNQQLELVRKNTDQRITELQKQTDTLTSASGRILGRLVLTGSGTRSLPDGTQTIDVEMVGGGGGGGGGQGGAGAGSAGGGASGIYLMFSITVSDPRISWSAGVSGAGGAAGNNPGSAGGDTTLTANGTTYTAKGGGGGSGAANSASAMPVLGGILSSGSSPADKVSGSVGGNGLFLGGFFASGNGGSSPMGAGGNYATGNNPGIAAFGSGGGGSGGNAGASNQPGGAGGAGELIIVARS